jgi:carboxymethylenebutenolidase
MDKRVIDLYNEYVHSALPRREFLARLAKITGGAAAAAAVLPLLEPSYAQARQVAEDDRRLTAGYVTYRGATSDVRAYRARPKGQGKLPSVLVIHENRGLNAHIEDVARRAALAGYLAVAPDGLSSVGGAPADQEQARDLFQKTDPDKIAGDLLAAVPWLATHPESNGKAGVVGFCYGGGMALRAAAERPGLAAAVSFYGQVLPSADVAKLKKVPVLLHYAGSDERVNAGIAEFRAALDANGVAYSLNMYPGTQHGFHNDASAARYDANAARVAWERTLEFFAEYLKMKG